MLDNVIIPVVMDGQPLYYVPDNDECAQHWKIFLGNEQIGFVERSKKGNFLLKGFEYASLKLAVQSLYTEMINECQTSYSQSLSETS